VPARGQVHQHLPGGVADAHGQLQARVGPVELLDGGQHAERAARRPLGVVLVGEGAPNTAMAPSPMNLSRVPPSRSISARRRAW
jgi:hypothetical protein